MSDKKVKRRWTAVAVKPPVLNSRQWLYSTAIGIIFIILALLQLMNYADFKDNFAVEMSNGMAAWSVGIIFAELWAAAGFFNLRLSPLFRKFSNGWALLVCLFWFFWSAYLWTKLFAYNVNFFGDFLTQRPGFLPLLESVLFLAACLSILELMKAQAGGQSLTRTSINKGRI